MAKLGMEKSKKKVEKAILSRQVDHAHVPGKAFNIEDPAIKLINMIGGGFFNEPKYYQEQGDEDAEISSQAQEVIATAEAVANSENPEDLLIIARWARDHKNGLKIRTTPQILLAVAASNDNTKPFVAKYAPHINQRADDIRQTFAAFRALFQKGKTRNEGSLPHSLRKGLAASFRKFGEYDFLKNDGDGVSFKDVLLMIGGSRKVPNPVSKEVFEFLVNQKVINKKATPMFAAREKLNSTDDFSKVTAKLLEDSGATWEVVVSKFGSTKKVWEAVIPLMGEMALLRNLRNFEQAGISKDAWDSVYETLIKHSEKSSLLPFRYYSAYEQVSTTDAKSSIATAMDNSIRVIPELEGVTFAVTDNSGSAQGATISGKSSVRVADAGNTLMSMIAKRFGRKAIIGIFGDAYKQVAFSSADSTLSIKKEIERLAQDADREKEGFLAIPEFKRGRGIGQGTETGLWWALKDITDRKVHVDRIVLLSDLCCYTQGDINCGHRMDKYFGKKASIATMVQNYRDKVNPNVFVYSVNLNGHAQAQTDPTDKRSMLLSGWSEKIFNIINDFETSFVSSKKHVPTLGVLREQFGVATEKAAKKQTKKKYN